MNEWKKFLKSGKVADYLEYKKKQREEENGKGSKRGNNTKDN